MNIKIDNMVDLRAFCLEQAIKIKCECDRIARTPTQLAKEYETYILGGISLPDKPFIEKLVNKINELESKIKS